MTNLLIRATKFLLMLQSDQFGCMYVCLYLTEKETTRPAPARTVSDVLVGYSLELVLPDPAKPLEGRALRADLRLRNDVLG